jgi:hypothetical protein
MRVARPLPTLLGAARLYACCTLPSRGIGTLAQVEKSLNVVSHVRDIGAQDFRAVVPVAIASPAATILRAGALAELAVANRPTNSLMHCWHAHRYRWHCIVIPCGWPVVARLGTSWEECGEPRAAGCDGGCRPRILGDRFAEGRGEKCAIAKRRCKVSRASLEPGIGEVELNFLRKQFGKTIRDDSGKAVGASLLGRLSDTG